MKILFYRWGSVCEPGWIRAIERSGDVCIVLQEEIKDYHADGAFAQQVLQILHGEKIDAVVSYDYFPLLSILCEMNQIPYMAWIYDCPQYTLYSGTLVNEWNYLYCFDREMAIALERRGAKNIYSFPLGTDVTAFGDNGMKVVAYGKEGVDAITIGTKEQDMSLKGNLPFPSADISFVGSLYEKSQEQMKKCSFSEYWNGYVGGMIAAQQKVYGYNFIKDMMPEELTQHIVKACELELGAFYEKDAAQMAADVINLEISRRERLEVLSRLSDKWEVMLYSGSALPDKWQDKRIQLGGYVDYETQMPEVFQTSKINLNITSKTITSGIPQRVLDILACGGFCMTNYQPEIAEWFQDGEHLAMYGSMEELEDKTAFYLAHEDIRKEIVQKGHAKVCELFSLENRWLSMKKIMEENAGRNE